MIEEIAIRNFRHLRHFGGLTPGGFNVSEK
jgi:hypothetical protein